MNSGKSVKLSQSPRKPRVIWAVVALICVLCLTLGGGFALVNAGGKPTIATTTLLLTSGDIDKELGSSWVSKMPDVPNVLHGEESVSRSWERDANLLGLGVARFSGPLAAKWEVYQSEPERPSENREPRESRVSRMNRMDSAIVLCKWGELNDCRAWMYVGRLGQYVFRLSLTNVESAPLSESKFNALVELVEKSALDHLG
ncbi:hypothetical protein [Longispora urticae]